MNRWWGVVAAVLIFGAAWLWVSRVPADAQPANLAPEPAIGRPAPDFTLTTLAGEEFTLSSLRGKPVVLNFWATWCAPCRNEMPELQATATRYGDEVTVVGVDQAEGQAVVQAFIDELGVTFPIAMDPNTEVANRYNVKGMPTTFFIDADGIIRQIWAGQMNSVTLAEGLGTVWP